jgi:hypothetical protein
MAVRWSALLSISLAEFVFLLSVKKNSLVVIRQRLARPEEAYDPFQSPASKVFA